MANLSNLIVSGASRLLNTLYCKDIDIDGTIRGNLSIETPISSSVRSASHLDGAKGKAIINSTTAAGYSMLFRQKSTNGVFTGGAWDDKYCFFYTADSIISAGTNIYTKKLTLLDESGNSNFPGTITAPTFTGSLNGLATKATQDSSGQQITSTYLKNVSISGTTLTCTKGNNSTFTITIPDTKYPLTGKTLDASFESNYRTQTKGDNSSGDYISMIRNDTASVANSPEHGTGLAWGRSDTHGYFYVSYHNAHAYVGGGSADKLNWTKELAFYDQVTALVAVKTATLTAAGWSSSAPYTQTVSVSGITASDAPVISYKIPDGSSASAVAAIKKAWSCVDRGVTGANTITFYCYAKKPTSDVIVCIKGV